MTGLAHITFMIVAAAFSPMAGGCGLLQQSLPGVALSDSKVIGVLDSLDESAIAAARLAQEKASAPEVQAFAGRVLNEHRLSAVGNGRLAAALSLQPESPTMVSQLNEAHEQAMHQLRATSGPTFDRAYVAYEIKRHVMAFNFVEAAAEDEGTRLLKQELVRTGPDLLSHLSAARALERHLGPEPEAVAAR